MTYLLIFTCLCVLATCVWIVRENIMQDKINESLTKCIVHLNDLHTDIDTKSGDMFKKLTNDINDLKIEKVKNFISKTRKLARKKKRK